MGEGGSEGWYYGGVLDKGVCFPMWTGEKSSRQVQYVPGHTASNPGTEDGSYDGSEKSLFD